MMNAQTIQPSHRHAFCSWSISNTAKGDAANMTPTLDACVHLTQRAKAYMRLSVLLLTLQRRQYVNKCKNGHTRKVMP